MDFKNRLKQWIYTCRSLWIAGRRDSTLFGVVDDTKTTKFTGRACAVLRNSLPVVVVVLNISYLLIFSGRHDLPTDARAFSFLASLEM